MNQNNYLIKNFKYYIFCKSSLWVAPIITLFYLLNKLSYTEIFIIASFFKVATALFEVPTGAFADKFGHKKSVLLGLLVISLSLFLYPLGASFWYFIIIEGLIAIGFTLISGADESLFYDTLKELGKEMEYAKLRGSAKQYSFLSGLIGSIVASFLYVINPVFPFFISGIIVLLGLFIVLKFKDIESDKKETKVSYFKQIKESGIYVFKHKKIRTIIIYAALINMTYASLVFTYTPYFLSVGIKESYFGIIFALFNVIALFSARYNGVYIEKTKPYSLIILGVILFISYITLGLVTIPIGIIGILFQQVYRGISTTTYTKYINKCSPSNKRATILSYFSLVITLCGGAFGILIGIFLDITTVHITYLILAVITLILVISLHFYLNKNLKSN